jgi:hypothetical protein
METELTAGEKGHSTISKAVEVLLEIKGSLSAASTENEAESGGEEDERLSWTQKMTTVTMKQSTWKRSTLLTSPTMVPSSKSLIVGGRAIVLVRCLW